MLDLGPDACLKFFNLVDERVDGTVLLAKLPALACGRMAICHCTSGLASGRLSAPWYFASAKTTISSPCSSLLPWVTSATWPTVPRTKPGSASTPMQAWAAQQIVRSSQDAFGQLVFFQPVARPQHGALVRQGRVAQRQVVAAQLLECGIQIFAGRLAFPRKGTAPKHVGITRAPIQKQRFFLPADSPLCCRAWARPAARTGAGNGFARLALRSGHRPDRQDLIFE